MALPAWKRNRYPHTLNTPTGVHEHTHMWLKPIEGNQAFPPEEGPYAGDVDEYRRGGGRMPAPVSVDLVERASKLAAEHDLPAPSSIAWEVMRHAWGRCQDGAVVIAAEAAVLPEWVLDGIIVHELAHLVAMGHRAEFRALVNRYPLAREVDGYLACYQDRVWQIHIIPTLHQIEEST